MMKAQNEPVVVAGLVTAALEMVIAFSLSMGWIDWDSNQIASFNNLVVALAALAVVAIPLIGAYMARARVTPVANPRNNEGVELVAKAE